MLPIERPWVCIGIDDTDDRNPSIIDFIIAGTGSEATAKWNKQRGEYATLVWVGSCEELFNLALEATTFHATTITKRNEGGK